MIAETGVIIAAECSNHRKLAGDKLEVLLEVLLEVFLEVLLDTGLLSLGVKYKRNFSIHEITICYINLKKYLALKSLFIISSWYQF